MTLRAAIAVLAAGCVLPLAPCGRAAAATIVWNSAAPVLVKAGGGYGRIRRLDARTLLACYTFRGSAHVSHSHDEGKTWEGPVKVADHPAGVLTNTELCVLKNGDVLCFFNFRPREQGKLPYAIGMSRSRDGGKTWATPQNLYAAGNKFKDGCWEPACLLLPDGELQVYFANEGPYRHSDEQEISMLRSRDDGHTWSKAETIAFRKNSRDGMPVPVLARTGNTIVVAIEDNGMQGTFKPVIVASRLERNGWRDGAVTGDSPRRWGALAKPLAAATYAGGPYLCQFPGGPFVLSFQLAESGIMQQSRMAVALGDEQARDFGEPTFPFPDSSGGAQLWNSLFIKNASTVTAISETSLNGTRGIWTVDGTLR
ncbi:MAG: sialidase family protein [Verrucomicrobiota bacterium]